MTINEQIGFDTNNYYEWKDLLISQRDKKVNVSGIYRYLGSKNISEDYVKTFFADAINPDGYYTRVDLQNIAKGICVDVYARNNFQYYSVDKTTFQDGSITSYIKESQIEE